MLSLINSMAKKIADSRGLESQQQAVIAYGMLAVFQFLVILLFAVIIGYFTKTMFECLAIFLIVGALRKFTGGAHAKTMWGCIIVSIFSIGILANAAKYILAAMLNPLFAGIFILISYTYVYVSIFLKAPVDSPNKPIEKTEKKLRLKKGAITLVSFLFCCSVIHYYVISFSNNTLMTGLIFAVILAEIWQSSTLLIRTH